MADYGIYKEADGWSVWELSPHTGSKIDMLREFSTKSQARAYANKLTGRDFWRELNKRRDEELAKRGGKIDELRAELVREGHYD